MQQKTNIALLLACIALLFSLPSFSQRLIDKNTFQVNDSVSLKVGDDLMIGKPAAYDFVNIQEEKSKFGLGKLGSIANIASTAGGVLGLAGAQAGSLHTAMAGVKTMQTASTIGAVGNTADAINALNASDKAKSIIGKQFRILKFKEEGNEKRGFHEYAIVASEGKTNYRIEIIPAIQFGEILGVNGKLFIRDSVSKQ